MDNYEDMSSDSADKSRPKQAKKDDTAQTALLPKSFFQGKDLKVGKQCKVEIVALHESEAEVRYVPHSNSESSEKMTSSEDDYE